MEKFEEQKHFLALLARPGDFIFIDISKLDIALGYSPMNLSDIDSFTMHFSQDEIMAAIIRANIVAPRYLNSTLVIQDNQKHNPLQIIDRTFYNDFQIDKYLMSKFNNKEILNTIINKFRSLSQDEISSKAFQDALKNENLDVAVDILFNLPYLKLRKFIIYLIEMRAKEKELEKKSELIRDKAA